VTQGQFRFALPSPRSPEIERIMDRTFGRLRTVFLALFAIGVAAIAVYHFVWEVPEERCVERRGWWDPATRICARPVFLADLTGRPAGDKRTPEEVAAARAKLRAQPAAAPSK